MESLGRLDFFYPCTIGVQREHATDVGPERPPESPFVNATKGTILAALLAHKVFTS